mgnify:FL=1
MEYENQISGYIQQMRRIGYSPAAISQIVSHYAGYSEWNSLSVNQQRRLADDLRRHVHIARKWQYAVTGCLH